MTVLVTGGGGFLGLYLVELLKARGDGVRVFCRGDYPVLNDLEVTVVRGDVQDANAVSQAVAGCDTVFHTAAVPGIWGSWEHFHGINTQGTLNVLKACQQHAVSKLIYTSSPSVVFDGTPHEEVNETAPYPAKYLCHYPHSKALAEQAVLKANGKGKLLTCALRPHLIWGPRDNHLIPRLIQRAKSGPVARVGDGSNFISMSYVENVAAAHLQAAEALVPGSPVGGEAYFLNEPAPVNLWDWINQLLAMAGLPAVKKHISAKAAYRLGAVFETLFKTFRRKGEPPMTRFLALQLSQTHTYSTQKAQRDFGYDPTISLEEGMNRLFSTNGAKSPSPQIESPRK